MSGLSSSAASPGTTFCATSTVSVLAPAASTMQPGPWPACWTGRPRS